MAKGLQFNFRERTYQIHLNKGFLIFCLFFIVLSCLLGVWQIHRYHFKKTLLAAYEQRLQAKPVALSTLTDKSYQQFQAILVKGEYANDLTVLVQNRIYNDQVGFEVLTPLRIPGEKRLLLVDRGWIEKSNTDALPTLKPVMGMQQITGYIKLVNEYQFILGQNVLTTDKAPIVLQKIDMQDISRATHQTFYPFIMRLNQHEANGFVRQWTISTVLPQRHMGYAVQWFLIALVLIVAYICFCIERVEKKSNEN